MPIVEQGLNLSPPNIQFRTAQIEPADRFGAYHDLYAAGSDAARTDVDFGAEVTAFRFPRMLVFDRRLSGVSHERGVRRVRRDGFDHVVLHLVVAGAMIGGAPDSQRLISPGQVILFDMTRPQRTETARTRLVTVSVARDSIEQSLGKAGSLHGTVLPDAGGLVGDMMVSLARRAPRLAADTSGLVSQAFANVLSATLAGQSGTAIESAGHDLQRERVESFIARRLSDPSLDVDAIAQGTAMSRSSLYALFKPHGGVATYLQRRRLVALRRSLARSGEERGVAELAFLHGFSDASHCNRAFRRAFGVPPGAFRDGLKRDRLRPAEGATKAVLTAWNEEVM